MLVMSYRWTTTPYDGISLEDTLLPLGFAVVATVLLLAVTSAIGALRHPDGAGRRARPTIGVIAVAFSAAAVSAIPVRHSWNDGCNDHHASLPLLVMPWVLADRPETPFAYRNAQTLVLCTRGVMPDPGTGVRNAKPPTGNDASAEA